MTNHKRNRQRKNVLWPKTMLNPSFFLYFYPVSINSFPTVPRPPSPPNFKDVKAISLPTQCVLIQMIEALKVYYPYPLPFWEKSVRIWKVLLDYVNNYILIINAVHKPQDRLNCSLNNSKFIIFCSIFLICV